MPKRSAAAARGGTTKTRPARAPLAGAGDVRTEFAGIEGVARIPEVLRQRRVYELGGLVGASPALLLAALDDAIPSPRLIVASGPDEAEALHEDLALFLGSRAKLELFPAFDAARPERRARETGRLSDRTRVVERLAVPGRVRYIVAPLSAILQPVPDPKRLAAGQLTLQVGESLDLAALGARLAAAGFARVPMAEESGEWSVRGGIVDLYPRGRELPVRVELFGDEIESLRRFDPLSQRSVETFKRCSIPILSSGDASGLPSAEDRDKLRAALKRASLLLDVLPPDALIVHVDETAASQWIARFERARPEEELGSLYARFAVRALDFPNLRLTSGPVRPGVTSGNARILSATGLARDLVTFRAAVEALVERNDHVRLLCSSDGAATRVETLLGEAGLGDEERIEVRVGRLSHGFQVPALRVALLSYDELFGRTHTPRGGRRQQRRTEAAPEWTDLRPGDSVVHMDHGIAVYQGLETITRDGFTGEHLALDFAGGTRLYVPVTKASLVHKYVGSGDSQPKLSTIGGKGWSLRTRKVAAAVEGIAEDLLRTHALRKARPGIAFPPDAAEQLEFEATFPFELTPDQDTALTACKADMERDVAMDRLICGDVGFGKTELAVRAAFKVVTAGRQVAVLVPTTVLAEQHGAVFAERFAGYPILVEVLSRFRTGKEQREILERAAAGRVDVLVGTHRMVSGDVEFKDLGLLVVDEEQRFGVQAKEALRKYRATVDVLTLTATPIPRTLHMALLGLRDISSLTTAPFGRRAIETQVVTPDEEFVREAVLREIERGGQVFYIHNRVQTIDQVAAKLRHTVPEARIVVMHGQMGDNDIESRMLDFVEHRADVLVATTIVESGLDIPNANTIFIDRADWLGLAELHQLRGRVGRYERRAYCYLLVPPGTLATDAEKRVRAVEELSDLGAGFRIAMRDLEIRGAGSLLGAQQSGHIASVGYELYCQLLADAVKRIRKERTAFRTSCHVNLRGTPNVPRDYIPDDRQRIHIYRRLSVAREPDEVAGVLEEARDRFGPPPPDLEHLAQLARARIRGEKLGVTRVSLIEFDRKERVMLRCVDPRSTKFALRRLGNDLRVVDKSHCHLLLPKQGLPPLELVDAVLFALSQADDPSD